MRIVKYKPTELYWMLALAAFASLALGQSAYARGWVEPKSDAEVEAIIRRERAKAGDRIDALDSIIGRSASDSEAAPNTYVPGRYAESQGTAHRPTERVSAPPPPIHNTAINAEPAYVPATTQRISDKVKPIAPTEEIEVKGEDGIRGEDIVADAAPEAEPPPRVRLPPVFDMGSSGVIRPIPKPQTIPLDKQIAPTRLTDVHPANEPAAAAPASNGLWDDLNAARERARRAIVESWQGEDAGRVPPQNYPSGYSDTNRFRSELSAAERLAPQQAGLVNTAPLVPEKRSITDDVIAAEVREVEQELHPAQRRLLGNLQEGGDSESVPMLRPKRVAGRLPSKRAIRSIASTLSRNVYAKGSRPGEQRRQVDDEQYQPSNYKYVPENFYRHLSPKGGKTSVRTHSPYGDSE